ncbi:hypothetical protein [Dyadobacter sediminis]|uniref:Lipoprotein n=1 Tax=Dyadobacter sediminis TaxID=1493691 RepID=A0A5R9K783_9BACT|nr:hypothetical protein [Dyadobacter sediminis]TLU89618.1 hypothetical protein FEM55_23065 [Dyadobacter sediminis]GGC03788.1 hypothetical protein GCM10011325_33480 [Dyadobacter sediminis]
MKLILISNQIRVFAAHIVWIVYLGFFGCTSKDVYENEATEECSNLSFIIPRLYKDEVVKLYHNDKIILVFRADSLNGFRLDKEFCINYDDNNIFNVKSFYKDNTFIDTSVVVQKKDFGFILSSSYPLPKNWKAELARDSTLPFRGWGSVPIENSVRVFAMSPDTILKGRISNY